LPHNPWAVVACGAQNVGQRKREPVPSLRSLQGDSGERRGWAPDRISETSTLSRTVVGIGHTIFLVDNATVLRSHGIIGLRTKDRKDTKDSVCVGSKAPDFTLPSQSGEMVNLRDFLGQKPVVLFFYPKDDTPGCTKQARAFRDGYEEFGKLDAEVIGISSDSVGSHKRFAAKHSLPFPLLSDEGGRVRKLYGVPSTLGLFPGRVTYVVDAEGVVRHVFASQLGVEQHVEEARETLASIR
jgi:thioredoxin-dependent peroxiredoxin